jgi:hypothetical protein
MGHSTFSDRRRQLRSEVKAVRSFRIRLRIRTFGPEQKADGDKKASGYRIHNSAHKRRSRNRAPSRNRYQGVPGEDHCFYTAY